MKLHYWIIILFSFSIILGGWFVYTEIYTAEAQDRDVVTFRINEKESVKEISEKLEKKNIIRNRWLFEKYLSFKNLDTKVRPGTFKVKEPITIARVATALKNPQKNELEITVIPGWNLYKLGSYFEDKNIIRDKSQLYRVTGRPAEVTENYYLDIFKKTPAILKSKPRGISLEGYIRPDTYRISKDSSIEEIIIRLVKSRQKQFSEQLFNKIKQEERTVHEVLTVASILEKEVQRQKDKRKVADIIWRRLRQDWPLQMDSTVHYIHGETDTKFTTDKQRSSKNSYNTYEYSNLPPGPISNPSLKSIKAAVSPKENGYWYFLTDESGKAHFSKTLQEHNRKVQRYLRE